MEFNVKLQELRKQKGLTQEELAQILFVSRAAVSKWESGRGYPGIDSLKAIANYFSVTIDSLLSCDEVLTIAEADHKQKENRILDLVFGGLDLSIIIILFLPLLRSRIGDSIQEASLLTLSGILPVILISYWVMSLSVFLWGLIIMASPNDHHFFLLRKKHTISLLLSALNVLLFIATVQPYAAVLVFSFLMIKVLMLTKKP